MFSIRSADFFLFQPLPFLVLLTFGVGVFGVIAPPEAGWEWALFYTALIYWAFGYLAWPLMLIRHCDQYAAPANGLQAMLPVVWYVMIFAGVISAEQIERANPDNREEVANLLIGVTLLSATGWLMLAWSGAAALCRAEGQDTTASKALSFLQTLILPLGIFPLNARVTGLTNKP